PQPAHGAVEMMPLQAVGARDGHLPPPALRGSSRARLAQAMKHAEVDGALHRELEATLAPQVGEHGLQPYRLPPPTEDQVWAELAPRAGLQLTMAMGLDAPDLRGEPPQGAQQDVHGPGGGQLIHPAQGGEHALHGTPPLMVVFDDLQVAVRTRGLDADEHVVPPAGHHTL